MTKQARFRQDVDALLKAMRRAGLTETEAQALFCHAAKQSEKTPPTPEETEARARRRLVEQVGLASSLFDAAARSIQADEETFQARLKAIVRAASAVERLVPLLVDLRDVTEGPDTATIPRG